MGQHPRRPGRHQPRFGERWQRVAALL